MEKKTTIKKAIAEARSQVTDLYRIGECWTYNSFDATCNAWRQSHTTGYHLALRYRSRMLLNKAVLELYGCQEIADRAEYLWSSSGWGHKWTDFVN